MLNYQHDKSLFNLMAKHQHLFTASITPAKFSRVNKIISMLHSGEVLNNFPELPLPFYTNKPSLTGNVILTTSNWE